jgi:three-Cys-motif partner protein
LKLEVMEEYLRTFTTVLRRQFKSLWYVDAYAGTGRRTVRLLAREADLLDEATEEQLVHRRGSAQLAIDTSPPFDRLIFIDRKRSHYRALCELRDRHQSPNLKIDVERKDANDAIKELIAQHRSFAGTRVVMFLDPYGLSVSWETLRLIAETQAIDVWYFVSLEGLFRQAARDPSKITDKKREAVTRMLGTPDWERDWYKERRQMYDLFGEVDEDASRVADVDAIEAYVKKRLELLFPKVLRPLRLKNKGGVNSASLFLAISNPKPEAWGLAERIASSILDRKRREGGRRG